MSDSPVLAPPVRGVADFAGLAEAIPVVQRGNSVVLAIPPSPAYAVDLLAARLAAGANPPKKPGLMIAPEAALAAWVVAAGRAAQASGTRSASAATAARARHHLTTGRVDLLVTTQGIVGHLLEQSSLDVAGLGFVVLAWPELETAAESLVGFFGELPKDTARLIITADPAGTNALAERYAWRATHVGALGSDPTERLARCRTATTSWAGRIAALGALADLADRDEATIWTVGEADQPAIAEALAARGVTATFVTGPLLERAQVWFYDAPPPALLAAADPAGSVVLAPPGVEQYLGRIATRVDVITLPSGADAATAAIAADRRAIRARVAAGPDRGAFATVAPLLDQLSAAEVAVALQALWSEARVQAPAAAQVPAPRPARGSKVWIGAGKKDGVQASDVVGLVCGELKVARHSIGKVEVRDTFSLIELPTEDDARSVATRLAGQSLKGRRLTARVDRGPTRRAP